MSNKIIKNVNDFHNMVQSYNNSHPIFRGVEDSSYELLSKIGRQIIRSKELNLNYFTVDIETEKSILKAFKNESLPYLSYQPTNDYEWLALAQHHGLPTRLLDWSYNPLVSLFFATNKHNSNSSDAAIYVIKNIYDLDSIGDESPFEIKSMKSFVPKHLNNRITAQSGLFTISPNPEIIYKNKNVDKYIIKKDCMHELNLMAEKYGIKDSTIFPGMDSIAKSISKNYGLEI